MTKKVMICGGAGYIGSVMCDYFLNKGHEVIVVDSLIKGSEGIAKHFDNPNFDLVNIDVRSPLMKPLFIECEPDMVINLAGIVGDPACAKEPELATEVNTNALKGIVQECNALEIPLLQASTCSVYGSNLNTCSEKTLLNPLSHYAVTKIQAEELIKELSTTGVIFRFGTMYGVSPNMRYDLVVNRLVLDAVKTGQFSVFDGKQNRPFLHPLDLSIFFESLLKWNLSYRAGEVYNLVSENLSMLELGDLIERVIPTAQMNLVTDKEDDRTYTCRAFKAHSELDFKPRIRVKDGIQEIERELLPLKNELSGIF